MQGIGFQQLELHLVMQLRLARLGAQYLPFGLSQFLPFNRPVMCFSFFSLPLYACSSPIDYLLYFCVFRLLSTYNHYYSRSSPSSDSPEKVYFCYLLGRSCWMPYCNFPIQSRSLATSDTYIKPQATRCHLNYTFHPMVSKTNQ